MSQEPYYYQQQPPPPTSPNSTMAVTSMVAGIIGWTIAPFLGSLVAIVTGHMAKKEIAESMGRLEGDGMATAGLVMGYLQLIPSVLCMCAFLVMLLTGATIPFLDSLSF